MKLFLAIFVLGLLCCNLSAQNSPSLSLDSCKKLALLNNIAIKNADLDVEAAIQVKKQTLTKYFPNVQAVALSYYAVNPLISYSIEDVENATVRNLLNNLYAEYGAALGLPNTLSAMENGYNVGVTAIQPVFMGGQIVNGNRLAEVGKEAAKLQSSLTRKTVLLQTEESYWLVISIQEKIKTINLVINLLDTLYRDVSGANNAGIILNNDVLKVELKQNEMEANLLKAEEGLTLAKMALCQSIGIPFSSQLVLTDTIPPAIEKIDQYYVNANQAVKERQESQLLDLSLKAELLKRKMTIGATLPQLLIGIGGSYGDLIWSGEPTFNALAFATLQIPITAWWETSSKLKEHETHRKQLENNRLDLTQKMELEIIKSWNSLNQASKQVEIAHKSVENAHTNMKQTAQYYEAGLCPISDLLEAQTLYRQAIDQYNDNRISCYCSWLEYQKITQP